MITSTPTSLSYLPHCLDVSPHGVLRRAGHPPISEIDDRWVTQTKLIKRQSNIAIYWTSFLASILYSNTGHQWRSKTSPPTSIRAGNSYLIITYMRIITCYHTLSTMDVMLRCTIVIHLAMLLPRSRRIFCTLLLQPV